MKPLAPPLLFSKFLPPNPAPHHLERPVGRQTLSCASKIVLVRAPAGFGKTTCLLQLHQHVTAQGTRAAWLTLDEADNDLPRFLAYLGAVLVQLELTPAPPLTALEVVSALSQPEGCFVLFLDEFDVITAPEVLDFVREIIEHLPHTAKLIMGCRRTPALPLARLRARAQLAELGSDDLRFSPEETASFLRGRHPDGVCQEIIGAIQEKTEGWPAGVWLASLALQEMQLRNAKAFPSFGVAHSNVSDYLAEDVLAREPPHVRSFLLRTSILDELTPDICTALCPAENSLHMLELLSQRGLFISRMSHDPPTWRYHGLFADFLRLQLQRCISPDELSKLHSMAARSFASKQSHVSAVHHCLQASDTEGAVQHMELCAGALLEQGRMLLLTSWFD